MTEQPRTATLSEWATRFDDLVDEMEADGVTVQLTCSCGSLVLDRPDERREWIF